MQEKTIFIKTLGCKVNTYDGDSLAREWTEAGYTLVSSAKEAAITIINSCSVTSNAEKEARYLLRRFRRENPESTQVITGCYAQINSAGLASMPEVDFIVPNEAKKDLVKLLSANDRTPLFENKIPRGIKAVADNRQGHFKSSLGELVLPSTKRTRGFIKIQDGCNGFCSYCQIPLARGASRSVPEAEVLKGIRAVLDEGFKEIVLTGIHLGDYGKDLRSFDEEYPPIVGLLEKIFAFTGEWRLRLSSFEPSEVTAALMRVMAAHPERVGAHFHLPLQSGSDPVLKRMNRQYDSAEYGRAIAMIREVFPRAQITADVIPGFPGETEEDFAATCALVHKLRLAGLHVFPYSKRPGTAAIRMIGHLDESEIASRAKKLRELSEELETAYYRSFIGEEAVVLWEHKVDKTGRRHGKTANYLEVLGSLGEVPPEPETFARVRLVGLVGHKLLLGTSLLEAC